MPVLSIPVSRQVKQAVSEVIWASGEGSDNIHTPDNMCLHGIPCYVGATAVRLKDTIVNHTIFKRDMITSPTEKLLAGIVVGTFFGLVFVGFAYVYSFSSILISDTVFLFLFPVKSDYSYI